jgi:hypothetical protein
VNALEIADDQAARRRILDEHLGVTNDVIERRAKLMLETPAETRHRCVVIHIVKHPHWYKCAA